MIKRLIDRTAAARRLLLALAGCAVLAACSKADVPPAGQTEVLSVAGRVTDAMRPCDDAYRVYRRSRSTNDAETAHQRCLDAVGVLSNIATPDSLNDAQKDTVDHALHDCVVGAGARSGWLEGLLHAEAAVKDGESNAANYARSCAVGLIDAADAVQIPAEDKRLRVPPILP